MIKKLLFLYTLLSIIACQPKKSAEDEGPEVLNSGKMVIAADESLRPLIDAEVVAYKAIYPNADITAQYLPEQKCVSALLNNEARVIAITRELNEGEIYQGFTARGNTYLPAKIALEGVALIQNRNERDTNLTLSELKTLFERPNGKKLIFDNSNSSNLAFMLQKLGVKEFIKENVVSAKGNENVVEYISKNTGAIGIIGINWISDKDDPLVRKLLKNMRVMAVSSDGKKYEKPSEYALKTRAYPLERMVYLHTKESVWGLAKGFVRFSTTKAGQLVVEKMGLIPYYTIPRAVELERK